MLTNMELSLAPERRKENLSCGQGSQITERQDSDVKPAGKPVFIAASLTEAETPLRQDKGLSQDSIEKEE